ncbi:PadR family transcriptional regulator [Limibacillus halophilus]|jgi:PadR family transcriptional regulator AphA
MDTRTLCLAALSHGEASGYEIKKMLEEPPLSAIQEASFGAIYPALNRLADEGLVACRAEAQEKRPAKKVYALTDKGHKTLVETLEGQLDPDRFRSDFLVMVMHGYLLNDKVLARAFAEKLAFYEGKIEKMSGCDLSAAPAGHRFVHGFGLALYRAAADYMRENRDKVLEEDDGKEAAE